MLYDKSATELIKKRFSCRNYAKVSIAEEERQRLATFTSASQRGPFDTPVRFKLVAATEQDRTALRGLGTYGFIKNPTGFIVGAVQETGKGLEDFGYLMERIILCATDLDLGTCWLGGSFTRSRFAQEIGLQEGETLPAVTSVGYISEKDSRKDQLVRQRAGSDHRLSWENLFYQDAFGTPISREAAGAYALPLEMVRLGPSASNKQPWRIVRQGKAWHFYLQRSKGYRDGWLKRLLKIADIQRLDVGIAMCHFEFVANELDLAGKWHVDEPAIEKPDELTEYVVSWVAA